MPRRASKSEDQPQIDSLSSALISHALEVIPGRTGIHDIPKRVKKMSIRAKRSGLEIDLDQPLETLIAIDVFISQSLDRAIEHSKGRNHLIFALGLIAGQCYLNQFGGEWQRQHDKILAIVKSPVSGKHETLDIIGIALLRYRRPKTKRNMFDCFKQWS